MAAPKTRQTGASVTAFLKAIQDPKMQADCKTVARMMREVTGCRPKMWGPSMVGYGRYDYTYASGHAGSWFLTGFSPRKQALTLYIMAGFGRYNGLLRKLGKVKTGKSCLYIKSLDDVDNTVLHELIAESVSAIRQKYSA